MTQFMLEEATATALELHEATLTAAGDRNTGAETPVRARHEELMRQASQGS